METGKRFIWFDIGRICLGVTFLYNAIDYWSNMATLDKVVPTFIGYPPFWVFVLALVWAVTGVSLIINVCSRLMGVIAAACMMFILCTSTYRGFAYQAGFEFMALKFCGWFCMIGGSLMAASRGSWWFTDKKTCEESLDLFYAGRIMIGVFFWTAGWLHLSHIAGDSHALGHFPNPKLWVVLSGFGWLACAFAFWTNILSRLACLGAILLVTVITFMINIHGRGNEWGILYQVFSNLALIAGCLMISSRGHFWLKWSKWWYPPKTWGWVHGEGRVQTKNDVEL